MRFVRGLRLTMANTKKAKDPTEVALSAIQDAPNISDPTGDANRTPPHPTDLDMPPSPPPMSSSAPSYSEPSYEPRSDPSYEPRASAADLPMFEPRGEPQPPASPPPAHDGRETIGQLLQSLQKGRPARSVYTLATIFAGIWLGGCVLLTGSFLSPLSRR